MVSIRQTMMQDPAVTLCIINFNGARHLREAFEAVRTQSWPFAEVLLIDNASDDDSLDVTRTLCPSTRIIRLEENRGPGAARNAGLAAATSELVLFQDNDIRLGSDTVARLVMHTREHPGTCIVTPRVVYEADPELVQFDSADCHFLGLMYTRNADRSLRDLDASPAQTSSMVSACFLFNRSAWQGGPLFDESLGFNLEDHDFGVRAALAGHSLWVQPAAIVRHGSGTPGLSYRPGQTPSGARAFYLTVNRWIIITKCYSFRTLFVLSPALLVYEMMQLVWLASEGHLAVWWRAVRSLASRRRCLCAERRIIQRARRVGDGAILRDAPLPLTRHARSGRLGRWFVPFADCAFRAYWRMVRSLVRSSAT
jgi:GT2 family glycosyltransferase